ncbi:hypothetical protein LEP1GSC013_4112 [Leptospira interrogans serovar Valbuzzi str. Duyster]|nr:hypothetical protein LEP1GSC013_4112 [Leptospira interrogans serovar Valbuzzi str. Duyster]
MSYNFDKNMTVFKFVLLVSSFFLLSSLSQCTTILLRDYQESAKITVFITTFTKDLKIPQANPAQQS